MKKRFLLIISVVILFLVVSAGIFHMTNQKKNATTVLSERSQEFMSKQKGSDDKVWRTVNTNASTDKTNQVLSKEGCFEYTLPFVSSIVKDSGTCTQKISIKNPPGLFTISLLDSTSTNVTDASGVALRKSKPEMYTESFITSPLGTFISFRGKENGFEQTAFLIKNSSLITIALTSSTNADLSKEFVSLIQSFRIQK